MYKNLTRHPRIHNLNKKYRAILIGGTGATGRQLLRQLLKSDNWESVTSIGRRPVLNGDKNNKLKDIIIDSLWDMSTTKNHWSGHDVFFNCIGTTRKLASSAREFKNIEVGISNEAAKIAEKAQIPHASVVSASGANHKQWAKDWIHPLFYMRTIGQKEQTVISKYSFNRVSIFRPGMLIRLKGKQTWIGNLAEKKGFGLRVDNLASAMIRDAECKSLKTEKDIPVVYLGNNCIRKSMSL